MKTGTTAFLALAALFFVFLGCGGGGGGQNSSDIAGNWRGTLNLKPADSTPSCPFLTRESSIFRDITVEPDTSASYFSEDKPSQLLVFGLDDIANPLVGHAGYLGDPEHPQIEVLFFDSLDRDLSESVRSQTPCTRILEMVHTNIPVWHPADNSMIVSRDFTEICYFPNGQSVDCTFSYEGFFSRR